MDENCNFKFRKIVREHHVRLVLASVIESQDQDVKRVSDLFDGREYVPSESKDPVDEMVRWYKSGESVARVADRMGLKENQVYYRLERRGVLLSRSDAAKRRGERLRSKKKTEGGEGRVCRDCGCSTMDRPHQALYCVNCRDLRKRIRREAEQANRKNDGAGIFDWRKLHDAEVKQRKEK